MIAPLKEHVKRSAISNVYILLKSKFVDITSQSNEAEVLGELVAKYDVPRTFVEFGFSGWEFNCLDLARSGDWDGLLLDGYAWNIRVARLLFPSRVKAHAMWIDLDTLGIIDAFAQGKDLGVLSVDVDGNDYWFLQALIHHRPAIIVSEFNPALKMRPISVPYDPKFDRMQKHPSGEYYGSSLKAISMLCETHGYSLMRISSNGVNAFFVRNDLIGTDAQVLTPEGLGSEDLFGRAGRPERRAMAKGCTPALRAGVRGWRRSLPSGRGVSRARKQIVRAANCSW